MDRDYHYDMIKVLAHHAGFEDREAQLVAYACQYVDDANEFQPMEFDNLPALKAAAPEAEALGLFVDDRFDRVCTGHDDLQALGGALTYAQHNTYLPFHFVPTDTAGQRTRFNGTNYMTSPDCVLVRELVDGAVAAVRAASDEAARDQSLIRLGIALHSYIDSWAHKDFSGLFSERDNSVTDLRLESRDGKRQEPIHIDFAASVVPETGHAKAHRFPDCSHHRWGYRNPKTGDPYWRDNPKLYMEAARKAYRHLLRASGDGPDRWAGIEQRVKACTVYYPPSGGDPTDPLSEAVMNEKKRFYLKTFPEVNLGAAGPDGQPTRNAYDAFEWKTAAYAVKDRASGAEIPLTDDRLKVTNLAGVGRSAVQATRGQEPFTYHFKGDRRWLWFHQEAQRHRRYVQGRIDTPPRAADPGSLTNTLLQQLSVGEQLGSVAVNLVGQARDRALSGLESGQRAVAAWRPLGADLGFIGPAGALEGKKAWTRVFLQNSTPWTLEWMGDPMTDFQFADQLVPPETPSSFWDVGTKLKNLAGDLANDANRVVGDVGHGRYWEDSLPRDVSPATIQMFAACERDNAGNTMGGVAPFRLRADGEDFDLTLAFSRPLFSDTRKLSVRPGGDRRDAWHALGSEHTRPSAARYRLRDGTTLRLIAVPGNSAMTIVEAIDLEREAALGEAYRRRNPDVDRGFGVGGEDRFRLHYIAYGHAENRIWGP